MAGFLSYWNAWRILVALMQLQVAAPRLASAQAAEFDFDAPRSVLRLAALAQLPSTAEITKHTGVLRNLWEGYNTRDIIDPGRDVTPDQAVANIIDQAAEEGVNLLVLEGDIRSWVAWYESLAQIAGTVHPSYLAGAIAAAPVTRPACTSRSDEQIVRLGVHVGAHFHGSEVRGIFFRAATVLVGLEPADRYRALAEVSSRIAVACENGWMID